MGPADGPRAEARAAAAVTRAVAVGSLGARCQARAQAAWARDRRCQRVCRLPTRTQRGARTGAGRCGRLARRRGGVAGVASGARGAARAGRVRVDRADWLVFRWPSCRRARQLHGAPQQRARPRTGAGDCRAQAGGAKVARHAGAVRRRGAGTTASETELALGGICEAVGAGAADWGCAATSARSPSWSVPDRRRARPGLAPRRRTIAGAAARVGLVVAGRAH